MGMGLGWLKDLLESWPEPIRDAVSILLTGQNWPEGDEDRVWDLAEAWSEFAQQIAHLNEDVGKGSGRVMEGWRGDGTPLAFQDAYMAISVNQDSAVAGLLESVNAMSDSTFQTGLQIAQSKYEICFEIIMLLIELIVWAILIPFTGGGSTGGMVASVGLKRIIIQRIMTTLGTKITSLGARRLGSVVLRRAGQQAAQQAARSGTRHALGKLALEGFQEAAEKG